jgi:hypothetical protein
MNEWNFPRRLPRHVLRAYTVKQKLRDREIVVTCGHGWVRADWRGVQGVLGRPQGEAVQRCCGYTS